MRTLLALLTLCFFGLVFGASNPPTPSNTAGSTQKQEQAGKNNAPTYEETKVGQPPSFVINVSASAPANGQAARQAEQENAKSSYEWLIAYSTLALAVITAALAVFTAFLWKSTATLVGDAQKTSSKELRAYVAVEKIEFVKGNLSVFYKNFGQTPANICTLLCTMSLVAAVTPERTNPQMVHPRQARQQRTEIRASISLNQMFNVKGDIEYADVFERKWRTRFSFECALVDLGGDRGLMLTFIPSESGNYEEQISLKCASSNWSKACRWARCAWVWCSRRPRFSRTTE